MSSLGSSGVSPGKFGNPQKIALGPEERIYIADSGNHRIQVFDRNGKFYLQIPTEAYVTSVAVDGQGYVYTTHPWDDCVKKYAPNGGYIARWDSMGDSRFNDPMDIVISGDNHLYVADEGNFCIYKLTTNVQLVNQWGIEGKGQGEFMTITAVDVGPDGSVYVTDHGWYEPEVDDCPAAQENPEASCGEEVARVQKFDSGGAYITHWGGWGSQNGRFIDPFDVAADLQGFVYVADSGNHRVQKFTPDGLFVQAAGALGTGPGMFSKLNGLTIDQAGGLYTTEEGNNRVQVFSAPAEQAGDLDRAIIVAGGGPYAGNALWNATQLCANYAYRSLMFQGYTKDAIYYLSADANLDFDGNGVLDDVDGNATNSNLKYAIESWARDADDLFIYITNHGGPETFVMNYSENLDASELDAWLDKAQETIPGPVTLLYDACRAGSFIAALTPPAGKNRILATSAASEQPAYFGSDGSLAFSYFFWTRMFIGESFYDSYVNAKNSMSLAWAQNAQLDANGNGIPNEREDQDIARATKIGNETKTAADLPRIGEISPAQTLDGETSAALYADNVLDADGISRVWAVITPPVYSGASPDEPILNLPILELSHVGDNRYEATYTGFDLQGAYNIAIFAADNSTLRAQSLPITTSVIQSAGQGTTDTTPDVKANGSDAPVLVAEGSPVSISLSISAGENVGQNADWWILESTPEQTLNYFDLNSLSFTPGLRTTLQGPLVELTNVQILSRTDLSPGNHLFLFGVDTNMNGIPDIDLLFYDVVTVNVYKERRAR